MACRYPENSMVHASLGACAFRFAPEDDEFRLAQAVCRSCRVVARFPRRSGGLRPARWSLSKDSAIDGTPGVVGGFAHGIPDGRIRARRYPGKAEFDSGMLEHLHKYGVRYADLMSLEGVRGERIVQPDRVHRCGGGWHGECCVRV